MSDSRDLILNTAAILAVLLVLWLIVVPRAVEKMDAPSHISPETAYLISIDHGAPEEAAQLQRALCEKFGCVIDSDNQIYTLGH